MLEVEEKNEKCREIAKNGQEVVKKFFIVDNYKSELLKFLNVQ